MNQAQDRPNGNSNPINEPDNSFQKDTGVTDKVSQSKLDKVSKLANQSNDEEDRLDSESEKFEHKQRENVEGIAQIADDTTEKQEDNKLAPDLQRARSNSVAEDVNADNERKEQFEEKMEALEKVHDLEKEVHEHRKEVEEPLGVDLKIEERLQIPSVDLNRLSSEMPDRPPILVPSNSLANINLKPDYTAVFDTIKPVAAREYTTGPNHVFVFGSAECDQFYIDDERFESKRPVEVPFFAQSNIRIIQISCGAQHTAILDEMGIVYTWGNADEGCLGRTVSDRSTIPCPVELDEPVDLLSSGESHTVCANSITGSYYFWGTLKSALSGKITTSPLPKKTMDYIFKRKGITDIKSGYNHVVILSGGRVYTWGDNDTGALGTVFRTGLIHHQVEQPQALTLRNVVKVFVGGNHTFIIDKSDRVFTCGLNNYGQLGFESPTDDLKVISPVELTEISGKWINSIKGGEHHTLILMNNGWVFGAGRNDDGQLGKLDESAKLGGFTKLSHLPLTDILWTSHHFNYAEDIDKQNFYSWGMGFSFVLANGDEETVEEAFKINNEKFFKSQYPSRLDLGHSHVVFAINEPGSRKKLFEHLENQKREYRAKSRKPNKKIKQK